MVRGLLIIVPIYLAVLLLFKGMKSLMGPVRPVALLLPDWFPGRYTVFVPSIPTPFAGAVYVLEEKRVHPVDVPFTQALQVISRWGSGAKDLVAAMEKEAIFSRPNARAA